MFDPSAAGTFLGRRRDKIRPASTCESSKGGFRIIRPLAMAYFFEGLGYIVTATFIVAIIAVTPGLESSAPYSWVAVGFAASLPSTAGINDRESAPADSSFSRGNPHSTQHLDYSPRFP